MPIDGFPDPERHKLCIRCKQWHEPDEGKLVYPETAGPIRQMRHTASALAGGESAMRFICFRCIRVRRRTKAILFGALALLLLLVLLLEKLGLLH